MVELNLLLEDIDPVDFLGADYKKLDVMKESYPMLKFTSRGSLLKVQGEKDLLEDFKEKFELMLEHYRYFKEITADDVELIINDGLRPRQSLKGDEVLVYGPKGKIIKAKTPNQRLLVESIVKNDIVFAVGPAGSGKTYTAVAMAVRALREKEVKKIILTRPAVEAGENLGFLPGDLKEKIDPYLRPLYDALEDMIPPIKLQKYVEMGVIEIAPLAFMRGRTLDQAFVILDEAQNTTEMQLKMFLTRLGPSAKFVITGDMTQIDLPPKQRSGLRQAINILSDISDIGFIYLKAEDVVRHKLVKKIIKAYDYAGVHANHPDVERNLPENKPENPIEDQPSE